MDNEIRFFVHDFLSILWAFLAVISTSEALEGHWAFWFFWLVAIFSIIRAGAHALARHSIGRQE
jgi:hypothetical protein